MTDGAWQVRASVVAERWGRKNQPSFSFDVVLVVDWVFGETPHAARMTYPDLHTAAEAMVREYAKRTLDGRDHTERIIGYRLHKVDDTPKNRRVLKNAVILGILGLDRGTHEWKYVPATEKEEHYLAWPWYGNPPKKKPRKNRSP